MRRCLPILLALALATALAGCVNLVRRLPSGLGVKACAGPTAYAPAALYNAAARTNLVWSPFGRPEQGWAIYEPRIAAELRTRCASETPGFARAAARWQTTHGLTPDGAVQPSTFEAMKTAWQARRPFVAVRLKGLCPAPPAPERLVAAAPDESLGGKTILLRKSALNAYRRLAAAARRAVPQAAADPDALKLFSGYRSPEYDAARCTQEGDCNGVARAACSAHRTGLAIDMAVGAAPGRALDSSADDNRLFQSRTALYRWLVANAGRYGFVNYVFEPWHWEWTGQAP